MPPMCTPDKKQDEPADDITELYYNPQEESITDCSDSEDDEEAKNRMDKLMVDFPDLDKWFNLHGQAGEGTFSTVYVASLKEDPKNRGRFAIKQVVPTCHPDRIKFELKCLKQIGGVDNVAGIDLCLRNHNNVIFIMPFQRHDLFSDYVGCMDVKETANYMKNLLIALARVHKFDIIHRDIKPSNFLYDRQNKQFLLVDFGLAQQQPDKSNPPTTPERRRDSNSKRKRDPLSPLNGVVQDPKRAINLNQLSISKTPSSLLISTAGIGKTGETPSKENCKTAKTSNVTYIQFEPSPDSKSPKTRPTDGCKCYGKPKVCSACPLNNPLQASRAGTPGFRPPEVLFKYPDQTTAVDIWAAGIILLSILSNCTNFFSCPNDISALLELITIFGYENMKKIANKFGRYLISSEKKPQLDLRKVCCTLRNRGSRMTPLLQGEKCDTCQQYQRVCLCPNVPLDKEILDKFPDSAYNLLHRLLDLNPKTRISAEDALQHPFFQEHL